MMGLSRYGIFDLLSHCTLFRHTPREVKHCVFLLLMELYSVEVLTALWKSTSFNFPKRWVSFETQEYYVNRIIYCENRTFLCYILKSKMRRLKLCWQKAPVSYALHEFIPYIDYLFLQKVGPESHYSLEWLLQLFPTYWRAVVHAYILWWYYLCNLLTWFSILSSLKRGSLNRSQQWIRNNLFIISATFPVWWYTLLWRYSMYV